MSTQAFGMRHYLRRKAQAEFANPRRYLARGLLEEAGRAACGPSRAELLQPLRLDIQGKNKGSWPIGNVDIGVRLPAVDQHGRVVRERRDAIANHKLRISAIDLQQHVTMMVRMAHQRTVHVQQSNPAEGAVGDAQRCRHPGLFLSDVASLVSPDYRPDAQPMPLSLGRDKSGAIAPRQQRKDVDAPQAPAPSNRQRRVQPHIAKRAGIRTARDASWSGASMVKMLERAFARRVKYLSIPDSRKRRPPRISTPC